MRTLSPDEDISSSRKSDVVHGRDAVLAALAGLVAFAVYLRTLLPDVGGPEDTPKFQYLGYVLGTAHDPGYPLHSMLSFVTSHLPIGTIAFRANLLSAICGAVTVALVVRIARALHVGRIAAVSGGLTAAFGLYFWRYSVLAEVYTLASALVAGVIYWLIRWDRTGRRSHLYAAAACFGLALGNHLSIVATIPAILAFVVLSRARPTLSPGRVVAAGAIAAAGLLQYLLVWIRSIQGAPYLEAHAGSLSELVDVIRAKRFADVVMAFGWNEFWTARLPALWEVVRDELGIAGVVAAIAGTIVVFRRDWRTGGLVAMAFASLVAFVINVGGDLGGFMVSPFALAAVLIAGGLDLAVRVVAGMRPAAWVAVAGIAVLSLPFALLRANFATNDWSRRTDDAAFFRAVMSALPARFAWVTEGYVEDSMFAYMYLTERGDRQGDFVNSLQPEAVAERFAAGVPVFALPHGRGELLPFGFDFESVDLPGPSLGAVLAGVPDGARIALASLGSALPPDVIKALAIDRLPERHGASPPMQALLVTAGADDLQWERQHEAVKLTVDVRRADDGAVARLVAAADQDVASIAIGERLIGTVDRGIVAAIVNPDGHVQGPFIARPPDYRATVPSQWRPLYRVTSRIQVLPVGGGGWHDVTAAATDGAMSVRIDNYRAFEAHAVVYAIDDEPMRLDLDRRYEGAGDPALTVHPFDRSVASDRQSLADWLTRDGLDSARIGPSRYVVRAEIRVNDRGHWSISRLGFGGLPSAVYARADTDLTNPRRGLVFAPPSRSFLRFETMREINLSEYSESLVGPGWHRAATDADGRYRWTASPDARLVLPIAPARGVSVTMRVRGPDPAAAEAIRLGLSVNRLALDVCEVGAAWRTCRWRLPPDALRPGGNEISLHTPVLHPGTEAGPGSGGAPAGVAVRWIRVQRGQ